MHEIEGASTETHHQSTVVFFFITRFFSFVYAAFRGIVGIEIHGSKWSGAVSVLALLVGVLFISSRGGVYPIPCLQASCPASVVTSGDILAPISVYPPLEGFQLTANFLSILLPVAALPIGMTLHPVQVYGA